MYQRVQKILITSTRVSASLNGFIARARPSVGHLSRARPPCALALNCSARLLHSSVTSRNNSVVTSGPGRPAIEDTTSGGGWIQIPAGLRVMASALQEVYGKIEGLELSDILLSLIVLLRVQQAGGSSSNALAALHDAETDAELASLQVQVREGRMTLPPGSYPVTDPLELIQTIRLLRWSECAYAADDEELGRLLPFRVDGKRDLLFKQLAADPQTLLPAYMLALDRPLQAVVLAVRGTWSWADALINFTLAPQAYAGGTVHRGMLLTARQLIDHAHLHAGLSDVMAANPGFRLVLVGHSLGGGVAALAASLLRLQYPSVSAHAFCAPSCVSSTVAAGLRPFVTSYVNGDDVVARFHVDATERLRQRLGRLSLTDELIALLALDGVVSSSAVTSVARVIASASSTLAAGAYAPIAALARLGASDVSVVQRLVQLAQAAVPSAVSSKLLPTGATYSAVAATSQLPHGQETGQVVQQATQASIANSVVSSTKTPDDVTASDVSASLRYLSGLLGKEAGDKVSSFKLPPPQALQQPSSVPADVSSEGSQTAPTTSSAAPEREWIRSLQFYPPGQLRYLSYPPTYTREARPRIVPAEREYRVNDALRRASLVEEEPQLNSSEAQRGAEADAGRPGDGDDRLARVLEGYAGPVLLRLPAERPMHISLPAHVTVTPIVSPTVDKAGSAAAVAAQHVQQPLVSTKQSSSAASPSSTPPPPPPPPPPPRAPPTPGLLPPCAMDHARYLGSMLFSPRMFSDHLIAGFEMELCRWAAHVAAVRLRDAATGSATTLESNVNQSPAVETSGELATMVAPFDPVAKQLAKVAAS